MGMAERGEAVDLSARWSLLTRLESILGVLVEIPAALLVTAEIVILFVGVVARYGFRSPLIWSDELASILFLWLAMLGAVIAFRRAEHMRMTAMVAQASPRARVLLDLIGTCAALAFLVLIAWPAYQYAYEESFITTPALQIANSFRAAALPVGIGLMATFALLRLARVRHLRTLLLAVASVAVIIAVFLLFGWIKGLIAPHYPAINKYTEWLGNMIAILAGLLIVSIVLFVIIYSLRARSRGFRPEVFAGSSQTEISHGGVCGDQLRERALERCHGQ